MKGRCFGSVGSLKKEKDFSKEIPSSVVELTVPTENYDFLKYLKFKNLSNRQLPSVLPFPLVFVQEHWPNLILKQV